MWKFYIELFKEDCYGNYVGNADISDGLPVCCDLSVAKIFYKEMTWKKEDCLARKKQRSSSHTLLDSSPDFFHMENKAIIHYNKKGIRDYVQNIYSREK